MQELFNALSYMIWAFVLHPKIYVLFSTSSKDTISAIYNNNDQKTQSKNVFVTCFCFQIEHHQII